MSKLKEKKLFNLNDKILYWIVIILAVLTIVFVVSTVMLYNSVSDLSYQRKKLFEIAKELSTPKYDAETDFLVSQCRNNGVLCFSSVTQDPSADIQKFLSGFNPNPLQEYRIYLDVNAEEIVPKGTEKLSCDDANKGKDFSICHSVVTTNAKYYLNLLSSSYSGLKLQNVYNLNIMLKPINAKHPSKVMSYSVDTPSQVNIAQIPGQAQVAPIISKNENENGEQKKQFIKIP